jgi:hypothetical protein
VSSPAADTYYTPDGERKRALPLPIIVGTDFFANKNKTLDFVHEQIKGEWVRAAWPVALSVHCVFRDPAERVTDANTPDFSQQSICSP